MKSLEVQERRTETEMFARLMDTVKTANDHKSGWDDMSVRQHIQRLEDEAHELLAAITLFKYAYRMRDETPRELHVECDNKDPAIEYMEDILLFQVLMETADIANFGSFIMGVRGIDVGFNEKAYLTLEWLRKDGQVFRISRESAAFDPRDRYGEGGM